VASCWRLEDGKAVTIEGEEESGGGHKLTCVKLRRVFFPKTDGSDLMKSASFDAFLLVLISFCQTLGIRPGPNFFNGCNFFLFLNSDLFL
jgi:hypothetical protein